MLDKAKTLLGYKLCTDEGDIGKLKEFYFDDRHWAIRYLAADTGSWLAGRQVLISPYALDAVIRERHRIVLGVTRRQIEDEPALARDQSVSRQFEDAYYRFHGWPRYWLGPYTWGKSSELHRDPRRETDDPTGRTPRGWPVRSTSDLRGSYVQTSDGEMGHVDDVIIDHDAWVIRYLIVNAQNWWPGTQVLLAPQWVRRVKWDRRELFVALSGDAIRQSPQYTERLLVTREYEARLHHHYGRSGYWVGNACDGDRVH